MSGILVVAEHRDGELRPITLEVIAAASALKAEKGQTVTVAVIGSNADQIAAAVNVAGVDEIVKVAVSVDNFQSDIYESAVAALIADRSPAVVMLPHSIDSWGYAPVLAVKAGYGCGTDVFALTYDGDDLVATRAAYAEKCHQEIDFPGKDTVIITLRGNTFKPVEEAGSASVSDFSAPGADARTQSQRFIAPESSGEVDITQAEFMMSVGRGIQEEDNVEMFAELAETIGATLGCSRPVADAGWLPKYRQVGQSGKVVSNCSLYVAMGISGSVQHQAGMKHVENIIAVNTDPEASIFSIAKYGVVADVFDIEEELKSHFE